MVEGLGQSHHGDNHAEQVLSGRGTDDFLHGPLQGEIARGPPMVDHIKGRFVRQPDCTPSLKASRNGTILRSRPLYRPLQRLATLVEKPSHDSTPVIEIKYETRGAEIVQVQRLKDDNKSATYVR
jgi:hypothetical protein